MTPALSIIVCTHNRGAILGRCLDSLCAQTIDLGRFEILVVDNNSSDDTRSLVARYERSHSNVRCVFEGRTGLSHARNRGAAAAAAPYVTYLDDDAEAPAEWVPRVIDVLRHQHPDILGGPILPYYTSPRPGWFQDRYETRQYADTTGFSTTCRISGSNFTIRRDLVSQLGGFDTRLGMIGRTEGFGEDLALLLAYRARVPIERQRVYYSLECSVRHWVPPHKLRLSYMLRRQFMGGVMNVRTGERAETSQAALHEVARAPRASVRYFARQWRTHGLRDTDYVQALRYAAFHAGVLAAVLGRLVRPSRRTSGPG